MILALDLDGVFANFEQAVLDETGLVYGDDPKAAWQKIDKIPCFFRKLQPLEGAWNFYREISHRVRKDVEVVFLTARPLMTGELVTCVEDKQWWVHKHLSPDALVYASDGWRDKLNALSPGDVLLDDSFRNIHYVNSRSFGEITGIWHIDQAKSLSALSHLGLFSSH